MKLNRWLHIVIAVVLTALVVGVVCYLWHSSIVKNVVKRLTFEQRLDDQLDRSKDLVITDLRDQIKRLEEKLAGSVVDLPAGLLRIYSYNAMTDAKTVGFCLDVPNSYTLVQKLDAVADVLMEYHFAKGMIEVKRIEQRQGKNIAVVDLRETEACPYAWKGQYFQGSTGGTATTFILTNTFLQPEYNGTWVDGAEFLYEGKAINAGEWDHIRLDGTKYRK
jgi:hypothetical protein